MMNDPDRERLADFVHRRLPDLLRENGGKLRKKDAPDRARGIR